MSFTSKEVGLTNFPVHDRPPVLIPFFAFRVMVGCGLIMLALAWFGSYLSLVRRIEQHRWLLWLIFLSFPSAVYCDPHRLVHSGSWAPAVGGLRGPENRGRRHPVPDGPRGDDFARHFLYDLHAHLRLRHLLHLSPPAHRSSWTCDWSCGHSSSQQTNVARGFRFAS